MDNKETSDILYKYLAANVKLDKEEASDISKVVNETVEAIVLYINQRDSRFKHKPVKTGSYTQGLKVQTANEFDYNILLDGFEPNLTKWGTKPPASRYYRFNRDARYISDADVAGSSSTYRLLYSGPKIGPPIDMDKLDTLPDDFEMMKSREPLPDPPVGCTFVQSTHLDSVYDDVSFAGDVIPFLVQRRFKKLLQEAVRGLEDTHQGRKLHGPALTLTMPVGDEDVSIDLAVVIPTKLPVPPNTGWPRPGVLWPSQEKIQDVKNAGINYVGRHPYYWCISYSNCEKQLISKIDKDEQCRKPCHRIMKSIRENYWCKGSTKPAITSYHLKNVLFWECEARPNDSDWSRDQIWERFQGMTNRLLGFIRDRNLPHYFDPRINLLKDKDIKVLEAERKRIIHFQSNSRQILLEAI